MWCQILLLPLIQCVCLIGQITNLIVIYIWIRVGIATPEESKNPKKHKHMDELKCICYLQMRHFISVLTFMLVDLNIPHSRRSDRVSEDSSSLYNNLQSNINSLTCFSIIFVFYTILHAFNTKCWFMTKLILPHERQQLLYCDCLLMFNFLFLPTLNLQVKWINHSTIYEKNCAFWMIFNFYVVSVKTQLCSSIQRAASGSDVSDLYVPGNTTAMSAVGSQRRLLSYTLNYGLGCFSVCPHWTALNMEKMCHLGIWLMWPESLTRLSSYICVIFKSIVDPPIWYYQCLTSLFIVYRFALL